MSDATVLPRAKNFQDLTNKTFGFLTVRQFVGRVKNRSVWRCDCDCGAIKDVSAWDLKSAHARSCGCHKRELLGKASESTAKRNAVQLCEERNHADGRIVLNDGSECHVDPADVPLVVSIVWHRHKGRYTDYARGITPAGRVFMHNLLMGARDGFRVDHANGDGLDNRRENMRWATKAQNTANSRKRRGKSGYRGVTQGARSYRWAVTVSVEGVRHRLGSYATPEEAARVYDEAAKKYHGEFAKLNFPETASG